MSRNLRDELNKETGVYPTSCKLNAGEMLVGELVRYSRATTQYGESPIAVIRDDETKELVSFWLIHTVALDEFKRLRPRPGERIGIKRLADAEKGYKRYVVKVDRDEPEVPDFEEFGATSDQHGHPDHKPSGDFALGQTPPPHSDSDAEKEIPF